MIDLPVIVVVTEETSTKVSVFVTNDRTGRDHKPKEK